MYQGLIPIGQWFENIQQTPSVVETGRANVVPLLTGFDVVQVFINNIERGVGLGFPSLHFPPGHSGQIGGVVKR